MLAEVSQALDFLQQIQEKHKFVSNKTGALHHACEQLMEDQVKLCMFMYWKFVTYIHSRVILHEQIAVRHYADIT